LGLALEPQFQFAEDEINENNRNIIRFRKSKDTFIRATPRIAQLSGLSLKTRHLKSRSKPNIDKSSNYNIHLSRKKLKVIWTIGFFVLSYINLYKTLLGQGLFWIHTFRIGNNVFC
jgi:hypothetical protein